MGALCLIAGAGGRLQAQPAGPLFDEAAHIATGAGPTDVAAGLLDRDQHIDLVVANNRARTLTVLLGNGDGTFRTPQREGVPQQPDTGGDAPVSVTIGDLDGDRLNDLVVVFDQQSTVAVYLGDGDGIFVERTRQPVGPGPQAAVLADFAFDGFLDVATVNAFDDSISVLPGTGDGDLLPERVFSVGGGPCGLDTGDFNGDGFADLAAGLTLDNGVVVLLNRGLIEEEPFVNFSGTRCIGDCNGDGEVTVDELVRGVNFALGNPVPFCEAFDFDFDGEITVDELVRAVNSSLSGICDIGAFALDFVPAGLRVSDADRDDVTDLLIASEASQEISVIFGRGNGSFNVPEEFSIGRPSRGLAVADLNRDANLDLIATSPQDDLVSALFGSTAGGMFTFGGLQSFPVHDAPSGGLNCGGVAVADLNGDQFPDVITANEASNDISILLNNAGTAP